MKNVENLDLTALSWDTREVVIVGIIAVLFYMLWQLIKMLKLTLGLEKKSTRGGLLDKDIHWAVEDRNFSAPNLGKSLRVPAPQREIPLRPLVPANNPPAFMANPAVVQRRSVLDTNPSKPILPRRGGASMSRPGFAETTFIDGVERELEEIRGELTGVRKDLNTLKKEWDTELKQMRVTHSTSPIYGDAMQLAVQGYDAATIADRCDIPPGEASLVVALVGKKRQRA